VAALESADVDELFPIYRAAHAEFRTGGVTLQPNTADQPAEKRCAPTARVAERAVRPNHSASSALDIGGSSVMSRQLMATHSAPRYRQVSQ